MFLTTCHHRKPHSRCELRGLLSTCLTAVPPMLLELFCRCASGAPFGHKPATPRGSHGVSLDVPWLKTTLARLLTCAPRVISRCSAGEAHNYLNPHWRAERVAQPDHAEAHAAPVLRAVAHEKKRPCSLRRRAQRPPAVGSRYREAALPGVVCGSSAELMAAWVPRPMCSMEQGWSWVEESRKTADFASAG